MANKKMKLAGLAAAALALNMGFAVHGASAQGLAEALNNPSDGVKSTAVFFGADFEPHSWSLESGFVTAFSGDISQDGFLFAGVLGYGESNGGGGVDTDSWSGKALVGYQTHMSDFYAAIFAGVGYLDNNTKPSSGAIGSKTEGDKFGFAVEGELESSAQNALYFGLGASYNTAYDTYWARARVGYAFAPIKFGPEITAQGDDDGDSQKYGVFVSDIELGMFNVGATLGYIDEKNCRCNNRGDGVYGGVEASTEF